MPEMQDRIIACRGREILLRTHDDEISFLTYQEIKESIAVQSDSFLYLFTIDETGYYLAEQLDEELFPGTAWVPLEQLRRTSSRTEAFAGVTAYQLSDWYGSRKYCPRCGLPMVHDKKERMMRCSSCGQVEYPKICPAVIVGVTDGDRILLTKYAGRTFKRYALIAGFCEIGESVEDTVRREVMEEVGVRVKNIRYYKSQPWSFSGTLLMGFFADLDGDDTIHLDREELSVGEWHVREDVPEDDGISLTREMMRIFREGKDR
jgi:NAD+ diphosphatase